MITSKATYTRPISKIFIDTFKDLECKETVNFPTRLENSTKRPTIVGECSGFPGLSTETVIPSRSTSTRQSPYAQYALWGYIRAIESWLNWHVKGTEGIYHKTSGWIFNVIITSNFLRDKFKTKCTAVINNYVPPTFTSTRYSQPLCNRSIKKYRRRIASRNTG